MAAPSKSYTLIPDSSVDADSPLDTTLMVQIRDNLIHLEEWLGDGYTAAKNHSHNGVDSAGLGANSVSTSMIVDANVTGAKVSKTLATQGSQSIANGATWTPAAVVGNFLDIGAVNSIIYLELQVSATWRTSGLRFGGGALITDGTNMRFNNTGSASGTIYYQTF